MFCLPSGLGRTSKNLKRVIFMRLKEGIECTERNIMTVIFYEHTPLFALVQGSSHQVSSLSILYPP